MGRDTGRTVVLLQKYSSYFLGSVFGTHELSWTRVDWKLQSSRGSV